MSEVAKTHFLQNNYSANQLEVSVTTCRTSENFSFLYQAHFPGKIVSKGLLHKILIIHEIMGKPNSIIVLLKSSSSETEAKYSACHSVCEENKSRGLVTRQTLNLT